MTKAVTISAMQSSAGRLLRDWECIVAIIAILFALCNAPLSYFSYLRSFSSVPDYVQNDFRQRDDESGGHSQQGSPLEFESRPLAGPPRSSTRPHDAECPVRYCRNGFPGF